MKFSTANAEMFSKIPICHHMLLMQPSRLKFSSNQFHVLYTCKIRNHCHRVTTQLQLINIIIIIIIINFRRVVNVVVFLFGDSPVSSVYVPTFRKTFYKVGTKNSDDGESPKRNNTTALCLLTGFSCLRIRTNGELLSTQ